MASDYLWDRSGEPETDVVELERLLGELPDHCRIPALGALPAVVSPRPLVGRAALALAATLVLVVGSAALRVWLTPWTVSAIEGDVRVEQRPTTASPMRVQGGQLIETGARSAARIEVGIIGHVDVGAQSRLRIVTTNQRDHRLALERGRISAVINAPPRWFTVDTPAAAAIDFGCAYTLEVDETGSGILRVTEGWVQLDGGSNEAMVPADAMAHMRAGRGPGSPHYEDSSPAFQEALMLIDFGREDDVRVALPRLLGEARPRDSITLLSLLRRLDSAGRGRIFDRLSGLLPAPAGVTRERIVSGDTQAVDLWWTALDIPGPRKVFPRLWGLG